LPNLTFDELIVVISWTLGFPDTRELELSHKIEAAAVSKTQLEASLGTIETRLHHSETEAKELRGQLNSVRLEAEAQRLVLIEQFKQNHTKELAAVMEQHEESKSQLMAQREAHVQSHQDELARLLSQVEELTRQVTRSEAERDALAIASEENAAERNAVEEDLRNQLTALVAQVAEATAKEGEVRQALEDQLNSMVQAKDDQHQQQLALAMDQLDKSRTVHSEQESKLSEVLRTVTDMEGRLASLGQEKASLEGQLASLGQEKANLEGQLASLGQEKASLEAKLANYAEALADIKGMNEAVLGKARDSEKEAAKLRTFAEELVRKNAAMEADIGVLRTELAAAAEKEQAGASSAESQEQLKHLIQVGNGQSVVSSFFRKYCKFSGIIFVGKFDRVYVTSQTRIA
jgi:chromosome segregation ATPase